MPAKKTTAAKKTVAAKKTTAAKTTAAKKTTAAEKKTTAAEKNAMAAAKAAETKEAKAAKPAEKKAAAPARAVARPVTRVVRREAAPAVRAKPEPRPKPARAERRPLPTAPAGQVPLIAADGSVAGSLALPGALVTPARRMATLFQAFLAARANARQATSATKNRSRVSGGGAKPWRQKGTGRARQGTIRAPQWRHGGVVFGPNGRRYEQRIPEKMRRAAFAEAVSSQAAAGRVLVLEGLRLDGERPKTRDAVAWLGRIGDTGATVIVSPALDERIGRATANLPLLALRTPGTLRLEDVLDADTLLVERGALAALAARAGETRTAVSA